MILFLLVAYSIFWGLNFSKLKCKCMDDYTSKFKTHDDFDTWSNKDEPLFKNLNSTDKDNIIKACSIVCTAPIPKVF